MTEGNSQPEPAEDEEDRLERRRGRRVRRDEAVAALPGDGLVELEGRDRWYCQGVDGPGLVIRLLSRLRLVPSVAESGGVAR